MDRFLQLFGDNPAEYVVNSLLMAFIAYWAWRLILSPLLAIIRNLWMLRAIRTIGVLEITPPKQPHTQPLNTKNLFAVLQMNFKSKSPVSFEIVGDKKNGIRYRAVADKDDLPSIQKHFASYMPELKFKYFDTAPPLRPGAVTMGLKQTRSFAYPLKPQEDLTETDPIAFIAGSMTQLKDDEEVALQLILRQYSSRKASRIYNQILKRGHAKVDGILKLSQPLFLTDMRFSAYSSERTATLLNDFAASLETLNSPGFQNIQYSRHPLAAQSNKYSAMLFSHRLGSVLPCTPSVLSAGELASIFHFPQGLIRTEGMVRTHSRVLPAPISLHGNPNLTLL
ncbi:hypothetical protein IPL85_00010 [Candidatus Saccharibacteria bacterium]|nr:MAG: hypothetical protein IPL85_00010 [Candidatus Saccharibacteria bacterium]